MVVADEEHWEVFVTRFLYEIQRVGHCISGIGAGEAAVNEVVEHIDYD